MADTQPRYILEDESPSSAAPSESDAGRYVFGDETTSGEHPPEPSKLESGIRGAEQGFLFNRAPQLKAAAAASPIAPTLQEGVPRSANAIDAILGGARIGTQALGRTLGLSNDTSAGDTYDKVLADEKAKNAAAQYANPLSFLAGNIVGTAINPLARAAPINMKGGAALGAVYGSGEGDTWSEQGKNALIGGVAGGALNGVLGNVIGNKTPQVSKTLQDAADLGVDIPKYMASPSVASHSVAQLGRSFPIVGEPIIAASQNMSKQLGAAADQLGGLDAAQAGSLFGSNIRNWIQNEAPAQMDRAYTAAENSMNPTATTPLANTATVAQKILGQRNTNAIPGDSGAVKLVSDALNRPGGLTYSGVKGLRTYVRQQLDNPSLLPSDINGAELKQLYSGLTQDLNAAAQTAGGATGAALHAQANSMAADIAQKRESLVKLIGGNAGAAPDERIFSNIINAAGSKPGSANAALLQQAKSISTPRDWQNAASGVISRLGRDADGNFSTTRFLGPSGYNSLSDAGKDTLFGPIGSTVRDNLEKIANVSRQYSKYMELHNTSNTGNVVAGVEGIKQFIAHPFDFLATVLGGRYVADMMSRPATSGALADWTKNYLDTMRTSPITSTAGLAGEGAFRASLGALKASTRNLATMHAKETGQNVAAMTNALWSPIAQKIGLMPAKTDNRQPHAAGGSIKPKLTHEQLVQRLIRLSEQAKKAGQQVTKPLLNAPDDSITHALKIAEQKAG